MPTIYGLHLCLLMSHNPIVVIYIVYVGTQDPPIRVLHFDCRQEVFVILSEVIYAFSVTGTTLHDLNPSLTLQ